MKSIGFLALGAALAACATAAPPADAPSSAPARLDPEVALATFDSAWSSVNRTFWDTTFYGVNWPAVRDSLRPRAQQATSNAELRRVITAMLDELGQSHFNVIPAEASESLRAAGPDREGDPGDAGMEVRYVDGRVLVSRVVPGGAADAAGIRPGWTVEAAGAMTAQRVADAVQKLSGTMDPRRVAYMAAGAMGSTFRGTAGDTLRVKLTDGEGRPVERALVLRELRGQMARFGNLPPIEVRVEQDTLRAGGRTIGVIGFNIWLPAAIPALDRAVDELRGADGIVIDLRGNPGGLGGMAPGWAGHFVDRRDTLGTMITRRDRLEFVINPRRVNAAGQRVQPFAGPLAILTDEMTASTSEIFAGGLQALGRARVFGATSSGQALPSLMPRLPNGDVLLHAVADMKGPGGVRWEGPGVVPDTPAPVTREALLAGRDPALDAAVAWIVEQNSRR